MMGGLRFVLMPSKHLNQADGDPYPRRPFRPSDFGLPQAPGARMAKPPGTEWVSAVSVKGTQHADESFGRRLESQARGGRRPTDRAKGVQG